MTSAGDYMRLDRVTQEIADVIGRERALFLVGQLPRCYPPSGRSKSGSGTERVTLYVPTERRLKPDHQLVRILGWHDAVKLCRHFGGEILMPGNCRDVYREFRDASIARLVRQGLPARTVAEWFDLTERHVKSLVREIPQEERGAPANDNRPVTNRARASNGQSN